MQMFDNINMFVKDDLKQEIRAGSKVSIAAACFSIYAYQELKEQLSDIAELRFIFTSPTFTTERAPKKNGNFSFPDRCVNQLSAALILKSNSVTNLPRRLSPKNVPTGSGKR